MRKAGGLTMMALIMRAPLCFYSSSPKVPFPESQECFTDVT
jgi:hypothetical protein